MTKTSDKIWQAHIITAFPDMFPGHLGQSLAGRAHEKNIWAHHTHNLHQFGHGTHNKIDDVPAGGGAGMVLRADVAAAAIDAISALAPDVPIIMPSARAAPFTQEIAQELAAGNGALFLCTRFEGVDERLLARRPVRAFSIGDYILSGGEVAALVMLDAIIRLLDGVMGASQSAVEESFSGGAMKNLLEYPHYTKPEAWEGLDVPPILRSGNHAKIAAWRREAAQATTRTIRPDLWANYQTQKNKEK